MREARKHDHKIKSFDLKGNQNRRWVGVHEGTSATVPVLTRTLARTLTKQIPTAKVVDLGKEEDMRWGVELSA